MATFIIIIVIGLNNMPIIIRKSVELLSARRRQEAGRQDRGDRQIDRQVMGLSYTQRKGTSVFLEVC